MAGIQLFGLNLCSKYFYSSGFGVWNLNFGILEFLKFGLYHFENEPPFRLQKIFDKIENSLTINSGLRTIVKTKPNIAPQKCASWPTLSIFFFPI